MTKLKHWVLDFPLHYFLLNDDGTLADEQPGLPAGYMDLPSVPVNELFAPINHAGDTHVK